MSREIDVRVAKARGWRNVILTKDGRLRGNHPDPPSKMCWVPHYRESTGCAFLIVDWMIAQGWQFSLESPLADTEMWWCMFSYHEEGQSARHHTEMSPNRAEAICLAFLEARGVEAQEERENTNETN